MARVIPLDEAEELCREAGIDLDTFRLDSQETLYSLLLQWAHEAKASVDAMAEARSSLMDATVYGDYRAINYAANHLGKTMESSVEAVLKVVGQPDSPLQIKAAREDRTGERRLSPITEALFALDGPARENLRTAFLALLKTATVVQSKPVSDTSAVPPEEPENAATIRNDPADAAPKTPERHRSKRPHRKHRRLRKKSAAKAGSS